MYDLTESVGFGIEVAIPNGEYSLPREHSLAVLMRNCQMLHFFSFYLIRISKK